jgi:hypothetical protein
MSQEAQSWRDLSQMLQGLMQETEGRACTENSPCDAPAHPGAGVGQERPPPESGSARLRPAAGIAG